MNRRSGVFLLLVAILVAAAVNIALLLDTFFEKVKIEQKLMIQGAIGGASAIVIILLIIGICKLLGFSVRREHE